ncbi:MAG: Ribonuclease 3 [Legionellaceae bacterium]
MYRHKEDNEKITKIIKYKFKNENLLLQALTRRSALNEGLQKSYIGDFQRLEFIGDRVLNLIISEILYDIHPDWKEGQLTTELNNFTNNNGPLADIAKNLKLDKFLILGAGEEMLSLRKDVKVLSDAFEALIGAIWLDSNNDYTLIKNFVKDQFILVGLIDSNEIEQEPLAEFNYNEILEEVRSEIIETAFPDFDYGDDENGPCIPIGELLGWGKKSSKFFSEKRNSSHDFFKSSDKTDTHDASSLEGYEKSLEEEIQRFKF